MAVDSYDPTTGHPIFYDSGAPDIAFDPTEVARYASKVGTRLIGTTAERVAYQYARPGLQWYDTTEKREYVYHQSAGWLHLLSGVIIPGGVVGGTVDSTGTVLPNAGVSSIRLDGIFSPLYRSYQIDWEFNFAGGGAPVLLQLTQHGTAYSGADYHSQRLAAEGQAIGATSQSNQTSWPGAGTVAAFIRGTWEITNPCHYGPKFLSVDATRAPGTGGLAFERGWLGDVDSESFDGLAITVTGQSIVSGPSYLKVRGIS